MSYHLKKQNQDPFLENACWHFYKEEILLVTVHWERESKALMMASSKRFSDRPKKCVFNCLKSKPAVVLVTCTSTLTCKTEQNKLFGDSYVRKWEESGQELTGRQCAWPYFRAARRDGPHPCPCFLILSHLDLSLGVEGEKTHNPVSDKGVI